MNKSGVIIVILILGIIFAFGIKFIFDIIDWERRDPTVFNGGDLYDIMDRIEKETRVKEKVDYYNREINPHSVGNKHNEIYIIIHKGDREDTYLYNKQVSNAKIYIRAIGQKDTENFIYQYGDLIKKALYDLLEERRVRNKRMWWITKIKKW